MSDSEESDARPFGKLTDREHVRYYYGMYIGDNGIAGLHHLADELINNAVDEVMSGHASQIAVTIHRDGSLCVEDDGRGIPFDRHEQESEWQGREVTVIEVLMTRLVMSARQDEAIKTSSGRHGIGLKAVNFLSRWCEVHVCRGGIEYQLRFENGAAVGEAQQLGPTTRRGTRITIQPDAEIFTTTEFDFVDLQERLRELALLHPTLATCIHDERTKEFRFEQGISQLVDELGAGQLPCSEVFRLGTEGFGAQVEIAFQFTLEFGRNTRLYVNDQRIPNGGTPVAGLIAGIDRGIQAVAKFKQWDNPTLCDEFSQRITAVIAIRCREPHFTSTRHKLRNPEITEVVAESVSQFLQKQFSANLDLAAQQWDIAQKAAERREEMAIYEYETDWDTY